MPPPPAPRVVVAVRRFRRLGHPAWSDSSPTPVRPGGVARRSGEPGGVLLLVVPLVGAGLDRLPPFAVLAVPLDGLLQPAAVERVPGLPAEAAQLRRVDGVAAIVT